MSDYCGFIDCTTEGPHQHFVTSAVNPALGTIASGAIVNFRNIPDAPILTKPSVQVEADLRARIATLEAENVALREELLELNDAYKRTRLALTREHGQRDALVKACQSALNGLLDPNEQRGLLQSQRVLEAAIAAVKEPNS